MRDTATLLDLLECERRHWHGVVLLSRHDVGSSEWRCAWDRMRRCSQLIDLYREG